MKNIIKITALLALVSLFAVSCNKYEYQYTYDGDNFVQLIDASGTYFVLEGDSITYDVPFQIIGDAASQDITMPIEFLDSAEINGIMVYATIKPGEKGISAIGSSVTIPAGSYTGTFSFQGTYDSLEFGEIDTMLFQVTNGTVNADSYNSIFQLNVQKYYPYNPDEYPGHYSGTYTGYALGGFGNWGEVTASPGLDIILGEEPQTLIITAGFYQEQVDDWGETWTDGPYPVVLYMNTSDPANFTVEIAETSLIGVTNDTWEYWVAPHPSPGQFNAATKQLTIKFYELYEGDALNDIGIYTVTLDDATAAKLINSGVREVSVNSRSK